MNDLVNRLVKIGFTEYEAKAYIALQQHSPATGYQIAKESGVPRSTIYQVLDKLIARGAVATQSFGDMTRYSPTPPDLLFDRMRHEFEDRLDDLTDSFKQLAGATVSTDQAWNIEGRDNILARAREMIERAQNEVAIAVGDDDQLDDLLMWLQRAGARKLMLTIISPVPYDAGNLPITIHPHGQHLRQQLGHGLTLVVDNQAALIGEIVRNQNAIWTTNAFVVAWLGWCIKHEMGHLPLPRSSTASRKVK
jgi:predicted transcriptional regulator